MSFKQVYNNDAAVFDKPAKTSAKGFFIRRLMSLAGKPLMAEKNLPIQPANSELAAKCFVNDAGRLYRQQRIIIDKIRFKPANSRLSIPKSSFSSILNQASGHLRLIHLKSPVLSALNSNKIKNSPAQTPDITKTLPDKNCFENHPEPAHAYAFSTPTSEPELLGVQARLSSIKFTQNLPDNIIAPSLFPGINQKSTWHPLELNYPNYQIIYCSKFAADDKGFFVHSPGEYYPVLDPGNYGFLPVAQNFLCGLRLGVCKHNVVVKPYLAKEKKSSTAGFDSRPEFARNLIIECKTILEPICGNSTATHSDKYRLNPSWTLNSRPLLVSINRTQQSPLDLTDCDSRTECVNKILTSTSRNLPAATRFMASDREILKTEFSGKLLLNIVSNPIRSRMRLKLRLTRADYTDTSTSMHPEVHKCTLKTQMTLPAKIYAAYKPFFLANRSGSFGPAPYPAPADPSLYAVRRSSMRVMVARHANYCRKALKTIHSCDSKLFVKIKPPTMNYFTNILTAATRRRKEDFTATQPAFELIKVIYLRSMPFLMKISAPEFTDISLPATQRRALSSAAIFYCELKLHPLRRRNALRSLRFKLTRISEGLKSFSLRAPRRIAPPIMRFALYEKENQIKQIKPEQIFAAPSAKTYIPGYRGKLERFGTACVAPVQIVAQMNLKMPITGKETAGSLVQKHFINPAIWGKSEKNYNCRIKLTPHPFGFPEFLLPVNSLNLIESPVEFEYLIWSKKQLSAGSDFAMPREKTYLPPLSLKNPRRFLFPENIFATMQDDFYRTANSGLAGKFGIPAKIGSFDHDWGMQKSKKITNAISIAQFSTRARQKLTDNFAINFSEEIYNLIPPVVSPLHFHMPRVKRLLLSYCQFFNTADFFAEILSDQVKSTGHSAKFPCTLKIPTEEVFRKPGLAFIIKKMRHEELSQAFSPTALKNNSDFGFRHRPRVFRFPYQPDYEKPEFNINYAMQEEPLLDRLTFLDPVSGAGCYLSFVNVSNPPGQTFKGQMLPENQSLSNSYSFGTVIPHSAGPVDQMAKDHLADKALFYEPKTSMETRLDYEKSKFSQHIDRAAFLKLIDFSTLKLKKFKRIRNNLTGYLRGQTLPFHEKFSALADFSPPVKLSFDSLHWVILLRNFIDLTTYPPAYLTSKNGVIPSPRFSSVRDHFSPIYCEKHISELPVSLQQATRIYNFALPPICSRQITLDFVDRFFSYDNYLPAVFLQKSVAQNSYMCSECADDLRMITPEKQEYRRNIQLYIMYMALKTEDYGLQLDISDRALIGRIISHAQQTSSYKHPNLPEWLDLAETLAPRAKLRI
ncbi:MAG: hypothetical protein KKB51_16135 [Candidatus Riflebacteria bacterium]|nr:hypothetical protein [Candidatus Riflebacteria bacterium]